jgi:cytochrome P450
MFLTEVYFHLLFFLCLPHPTPGILIPFLDLIRKLFRTPTVLIHGQAANKFIFANGGDSIVNQQTQSIKMILGDRNLLELSGKDHSRVRGALVSFLKPESLKQYVGKIDEEVRSHIQEVGLVVCHM